MQNRNTIFALATAYGKSGVAVIRISGPQALAALKTLSAVQPEPNIARYVTFRHGDAVIDRGLAIYFKAPHSFTGEDVVELQIHGSLGVIRELLELLSRFDGLRPAEPGEFTRRAFLNGKMDLMQAEGLADLIDAETIQQKKQALRQMDGDMSRYFQSLRDGVVQCLALLEAYIDFPDEDIPESVLQELARDIDTLRNDLKSVLADRKCGERLRDGLHAVILGAPNAGKSSLMNAIAKRDVAIVSHKAGTTRDVIEAHIDIGGFPVVLIDTAGLRDSDEDIEQEGIRRALQRADSADVRLLLFDGTKGQDEATRAIMSEGDIIIISKCDLIRTKQNPDGIHVSTVTGEGVDTVLAALEKRLTSFFSSDVAPVITRTRHRALLTEALACLERYSPEMPLEIGCEELRLAGQAIGKITGKIQTDDILDIVFKRFCIGK